jgi:uncharacterized protein (DUF58 family)
VNDRVSASTASLVALRRAGENLALPFVRIKARQSGTYLSRHKGRGMEFEEHRLYQPGDDIRNIDWRVTARTGSAHTKVFREERERPVLFCVDYRRPMFFATRGVFKSVMAARAAAVLAWSSAHHGDRVGGLIFSETHHQELRPQRGSAAVLKLIQALVKADAADHPVQSMMALDQPMARVRRVARPGSQVCIISDFRGWNDRAESHLIQIARHNSVWLLFLVDPLEMALPPAGVYKVTDGARDSFINTRGRSVQEKYSAHFHARHDRLETLCRQFAMSLIFLTTQSDLLEVLRNEIVARRAA